jgi:four helix bundle protein
MAKFSSFEEIIAWQKGMILCNKIYEITKRGSFSKDFPLRNQIRRAAISIPANIAEGFERDGNKELNQFLSIAKGSCGEVKTFLIIAKEQQYIFEETFDQLYRLADEIGKMVGGWMVYLRKRNFKGYKYRTMIDK